MVYDFYYRIEWSIYKGSKTAIESQSLIERLSLAVKNQSLKQEANLFMLNEKMADISGRPQAFGTGAFGVGRYGGDSGPLDTIADALSGMANQTRDYLSRRELADLRFDPRMQSVKYLELIKNIPADYNNAEWKESENSIYGMLSDEISSNLMQRNIYSPARFESAVSVLDAERARVLHARERQKNSKTDNNLLDRP